MMATVPVHARASRSQRLEARLLPEQKRRIERAAAYKGLSTSDFLVQAADEAAKHAIEQHEVWVLKEQDWIAFIEAMENPWEPNQRLKDGAKRHKELLRG